jgi:DNA (cytosine-5)-methyltransferase 1
MSIPNHYSASLSVLDLKMAVAIPPGGNWKNIPTSIPSKRLEGIRESYKNGGGSRSTYYGRLMANAPAYTINTNFNRPGNGCHLHYDFAKGQHRVISQREAARLQSFPDNFVFWGNRGSVNNQIGNAVPPLLAYQIALNFPMHGSYVDLFSGAGGLSLGFKWAGWEPLVANDIDASFLETYKNNIHTNVVHGDIRNKDVFSALVNNVNIFREKSDAPVIVLGGPPCQGFSTAGNRRSMDDERNQLFYEYKAFLEEIKPNAFLFENVPGLTNMDKGRVFEMVKAELSSTVDGELTSWILHTEEYGIPQRRKRIVLIGTNSLSFKIDPPKAITAYSRNQMSFLPLTTTVEEAIGDLPPLLAGEDGSEKDYLMEPQNHYQKLMRGRIFPNKYIEWVKGK